MKYLLFDLFIFSTLKTPGPGSYKVICPNTYRTKQPKYSLKGRKFMPEDGAIRPGPGIYSPEKVNNTYSDLKDSPAKEVGNIINKRLYVIVRNAASHIKEENIAAPHVIDI